MGLRACNEVQAQFIDVRLVLLDVVVVNGKGEVVTGLQKGDFEVLEDGKPQTISTFEEHRGAPPAQITLPPMPPHVYTNFPLTRTADSVNVVLLDALNTPTVDQAYVRKQMIDYLKQLPPATRVAIFTLAARLRMLQGVTTDSSELLATLNLPEALPHPSGLLQSDAEINAYKDLIGLMKQQKGLAPPAPKPLDRYHRPCREVAITPTGEPALVAARRLPLACGH
jgi:VWFA-related protein